MNEDDIKGFSGKWRFLSNFHIAPVLWNGVIYSSSEAAYQASKFLQPEIKDLFQNLSPLESKRKAAALKKKGFLREDWQEVSLSIMEEIVFIKFSSNLELREALLKTGERYIEETNTWRDTFWGVCDGVGQNNLGKILMKVRQQLKEIK
jgi:ribA/ribD-fused uncharacterized protein